MPALKRWGNSLAVRIPSTLARQLQLSEETAVECTVVNGSLVITPVRARRAYSLEHLLNQVTPENLPEETDTGAAVGKEIW